MDRIAIEVENPLYGTLLDLVIVWGVSHYSQGANYGSLV